MTDEYTRQVGKSVAQLSAMMENTFFYGRQPQSHHPLLGLGRRCYDCHGIGHDDGGPGSWTCRTCEGTGRLKFFKMYVRARWQPWPKGHPNSGTQYERKGWA